MQDYPSPAVCLLTFCFPTSLDHRRNPTGTLVLGNVTRVLRLLLDFYGKFLSKGQFSWVTVYGVIKNSKIKIRGECCGQCARLIGWLKPIFVVNSIA